MPALDAFTMKAETFHAMHTPAWSDFVIGFTKSLRGEMAQAMRVVGFEDSAEDFSRRCARTLSLAETFYVAPQMNALVSAAAEDWEADEHVHDEDFPTDHGWLFIPGGITNIDARGRLYATSALTWARHGNTVDVIFWANKHDDPPHMREHPSWPGIPTMTPWHITHVDLDAPLPTAMRFGKVLPPEVSEAIQWIQGPDGSLAMTFPQGWTREEMTPMQGPDPVLAWLVSVLRIMQQPLASVERQGLPTGVRRALAKHPRKMKNTAVTIIDFRRRLSDFEPGSGREYSHRFLRRGHWRRQPYKRDDGTWERRRIWIHPTIVGDPDKPLILREHVNALTR